MFELLETNRRCLLSPPSGVPFPGCALSVPLTCQLSAESPCVAVGSLLPRLTECRGAEAVLGAAHGWGSCAFAQHGWLTWLQL